MSLLSSEEIAGEGDLLFVLKSATNSRWIVYHVVIIVENNLKESGYRVIDWPESGHTIVDSRDTDGVYLLRFDASRMLIGRIDAEVHQDLSKVTAEANSILGAVAAGALSELSDILRHSIVRWTPYPARDYQPGQSVPFRGSCVGFVEQCFEHADIDLVQEDNLPLWDWQELRSVFSLWGISEESVNRFLQSHVGNHPNGLPVFMPGYQLKAVSDGGPYPHVPQSTDEAYT